MACRRTRSANRALIEAGRFLLPGSPRTALKPIGNTTAAATTGPARGPRPASSTPTRRCSSAQTARSRTSVGRGAMRSALALLPDSGGLAAQRAQVVQLRAAHPSPANQLDRGDRGAVDREEALDSHTRRDLADRKGLADAATPFSDDQPFERLKALLVTLADANHDPDRVSRIECRNVRAQALTGHFCQSFHGPILPLSSVGSKSCNILNHRARFVIPIVPTNPAGAPGSAVRPPAAARPRSPRGCRTAAPQEPRARDTPGAWYSSAGSAGRRSTSPSWPTRDRSTPLEAAAPRRPLRRARRALPPTGRSRRSTAPRLPGCPRPAGPRPCSGRRAASAVHPGKPARRHRG